MDVSNEEAYKCPPEFEVDAKEPLLNLSLTDSTELWLVQLPYSQDSLADIDGKELSLNLHHDGQLGSFEGLSGKQYDLVSSASQVPDATVFVSSATKQKIVGKISRRVSLVHYPGPKDLENVNSNKMKQYQNSSGAMLTKSSSYFPLQSPQSKHAISSQGSRHKSSLSEVGEPSKSSKRSSSKSNMSEDQSSQETSNRRIDRKSSRSMDQSSQYSERGHSAATSSMSSEHSRGEKSKKRVKRKE